MRLYALITARLASMEELKTCYSLDEAMKLYALHEMHTDVRNGQIDDMNRDIGRK